MTKKGETKMTKHAESKTTKPADTKAANKPKQNKGPAKQPKVANSASSSKNIATKAAAAQAAISADDKKKKMGRHEFGVKTNDCGQHRVQKTKAMSNDDKMGAELAQADMVQKKEIRREHAQQKKLHEQQQKKLHDEQIKKLQQRYSSPVAAVDFINAEEP